jgi:peptidoglycan/xylan/chitin deacetylase (PgdA/CDA1 family)
MKVKPKSGIVISLIILFLIPILPVFRLPSDFLAALGLPSSFGMDELTAVTASARYPGKLMLSQAGGHQKLQIPSTYQDKVAVLMYHDVQPDSNNTITITPQRLDADLTLLEQKGFHIIPVSQLAVFMDHRGTVPEKAVVLTFDDGYEGVYRYAFPVLEKHGAPAAIFLIGYYVGRLPGYLTWPEVRRLEESGLVTVGGHTYNQHMPKPTTKPNLVEPATIDHLFNPQTEREETGQEYEARMLSDSQLLQETFTSELGHTTPYFAYPYGAYNSTMIKILHETGFRYMFTTMTGVNDRDESPACLYRINAGATWISTKNLPSMILKAAFRSSSGKQPLSYLPEWKA